MIRHNNKGNVAIILCLLIVGLLGFTAYVIDIGIVYANEARISNALDAAALAASLELPSDTNKAKDIATQYMRNNNVDETEATISFSADKKSIQIGKIHNVKHFFAPIIGIKSSNISVKTKAIIGPLKSVENGIRPFAVEKYNFSYGSVVTLKQGAGAGYEGNYNVVALGGSGSNVYVSNTLYGYNAKINVGDWIDTEPGNMAGATNQVKNYIGSENSTFNNFSRDSIKLWTIPLVNTLQVNGRNQIQVTGFGEFYVEGVKNNSGNVEITGRFIRYVRNGEIDMSLPDTGAYSTKLAN